ncbi:hypothetical protein HV451_18390 [Bacillus sporothermodurans]|uniref:hypothetical protein n=1 Tax=Heyndrickxia sporothermodurans TaxID=46224 RepID=UPI00192CBB39|nr:hypothetical protein [Heyndrickxia sporothermodurans]MBL5797866.1 hypothetical protein [Heyndrickxia sporothermodurans]
MTENPFEHDTQEDALIKKMYGIEPEMSLLSVNFATKENGYLNEHDQGAEEVKRWRKGFLEKTTRILKNLKTMY